MEISYSKFISYIDQTLKNSKKNIVYLASSEEDAISSHRLIKFLFPGEDVLFFPSMDSVAYDRISPSARILSERAYLLTKLCSNNSRKILITNTINLFQKYPKLDYFKNSFLNLSIGKKFSDGELENFLLKNGYTKSPCAIEPGEFSKRGDIIDVVLYSGNSYRINFEWDKISQIKEFDPETQISKEKVNQIELYKASELTLDDELIENFKGEYLTEFGIGKAGEQFFEKISNGIKFSGAESLIGAFFKEPEFLLDYIDSPEIYASYLSSGE